MAFSMVLRYTVPYNNFFKTAFHGLRYFFTPSFCVHCKRWLDEATILCTHCRALIQPIVSAKIAVTPSIIMTVYAASAYDEPLKSLILAKSRFDSLASHYMGQLIWELTHVSNVPCDYIIPIPLHWRRFAYRGYNQATMMAKELAKKSKKPMIELLRRKKYTVFQSVLSTAERKENVTNAFTIRDHDVNQFTGKHLLLVDDLMTTGSTLKAAAKALLALNPASITAVVLCRT